MEPCGLQSLKYHIIGLFQLLYSYPITSFQLQILTSPARPALCRLPHLLNTSPTEGTLFSEDTCREKGSHKHGPLRGSLSWASLYPLLCSVIPQASLPRDSMDGFLPTPAPERLVPVPDFPFPLTAVRRLPVPLHPVDFGKWSLTSPATADTLWTIITWVT